VSFDAVTSSACTGVSRMICMNGIDHRCNGIAREKHVSVVLLPKQVSCGLL